MTSEQIYHSLNEVLDPELGIGIVDLGLIYKVDISENHIHIIMTMTSVACPMHVQLSEQARARVGVKAGKQFQVTIEVVHDPPWNAEMMSADARAKLGW
jgi:metal-sulfur cluster biosynthetic enzyme